MGRHIDFMEHHAEHIRNAPITSHRGFERHANEKHAGYGVSNNIAIKDNHVEKFKRFNDHINTSNQDS